MNLAVFRALDDEALAALASKGLLRRAQKDLEQAPPVLAAGDTAPLLLTFPGEGWQVRMPASGPAGATCTCPAEGTCRHILAAALFLRGYTPAADAAAPAPLASPSPGAATAPPAEESPPRPDSPAARALALTEADLLAWAGKAVYRQGAADLAGDLEALVEATPALLTIRLPAQNAVVRWPAGANLTGTICSCKRPGACRHRVAAILAYQGQQGRPPPAPTSTRPAANARSRGAVLAAAQDTVAEFVAGGLGRLAGTAEGRLRTLAVSAHGADLPRLERDLRALADRVAWQVGRDVRADAAALLEAAARTYALAWALTDSSGPPAPGLIGEHRSRYYLAGNLELVGLGAQQWHTRSGYAGLTIFFWAPGAGRWLSWSDSRPAFYANIPFDPARRYCAPGTWEAAPPPDITSRSAIRLLGARRNRAGRLSGAPGSQALLLGPVAPAALDLAGVLFADWRALGEHIAALPGGGLAEPAILETLVVVTPAAWGPPSYDPQRQALVRPVGDAAGQRLPLVLPHAAGWAFAVTTLETWDPARWATWGILGVARFAAGGLELAPIALLTRTPLPPPINSCVLNLTLDPAPAVAAAPGEASALVAAGADAETSAGAGDPLAPATDDPEAAETGLLEMEAQIGTGEGRASIPAGALATALASAAGELEALAEGGMAAAGAAAEARLTALAGGLAGLGLGTVAGPLAACAAALSRRRHQAAPDPRPAAVALLRAYYVLRLAATGLEVTQALAGLREAGPPH